METTSNRAVGTSHKAFTRLLGKHYSPMVVRKTSKLGFPLYVGLITDDDVADLDNQINDFIEAFDDANPDWKDNIQGCRNFTGALCEHLNNTYDKMEGSGVLLYADKCFISSLHGDLMTHAACKQEFYFMLNMSTGV